MNNWTPYIAVVLVTISLLLFLVNQLKHTLFIQKNKNKATSKRLLAGNYLTVFATLGFLSAFIVNVLLYGQMFQSNLFTSNNTSIACVIFFIIFLISKYVIIPREVNISIN